MYSLFVYSTLALILYTSSSVIARTAKKNIHYSQVLLPFIIISFFLGGRYNVGTDWENYKAYYDEIALYGVNFGNLEPLYLYLNKIISITGFSSSFFFFCISMIQLSLIYFVFRNDKRIFALGMISYFLCCLPMSLNIIRQSLAICVFVFSIKYIERSPVKYIISIIIAGLLHYSSFILLFAYIIKYNCFRFLDNRKLTIIFHLCTIFAGTYLLPYILNLVPIDLLGYKYASNLNNADLEMTVNSGVGMIVNHILNLIILWFLPNLNIAFNEKSSYFTILSRCYVVGIILTNIFGISVFLSRLPLGLVTLKIILVPYIYYYLSHRRNLGSLLVGIFFLGSYIILFIASVLNGAGGISPYSFKWI